ncbi:HAD family hydrolase [Halobacillus halophilus]|nr:HAD family hydrolase [Halobacillus halophilus]MCA1010082.1 HAD family hydrolase [Halobacillus halophilus]
MSYKGILLDLDNTLYDYHLAHEKALEQALNYAVDILGVEKEEIFSSYNQEREKIKVELLTTAASHNRMLYFQRLYENFDVNPQIYALNTYDLYWETFLNNMYLFPGVTDFLEASKDIPICLVTDLTSHIQHRKLKTLGVQEYIQFVVTSEEAGKEKPHPYIFMSGLRKLGLDREDVIMIGDNFEKDIKGASLLGIKSFWLTIPLPSQEEKLNNVIEVSSFSEVKEQIFHV